MHKLDFDWDDTKEQLNVEKHGVTFDKAMAAFYDPNRIIAQDTKHSDMEDRFYCYGKVEDGILTVRFTPRGKKIRIIGAAFWRDGRKLYDKAQKQKNNL